MRFRGFDVSHHDDSVPAADVLASMGSAGLGAIAEALPDGLVAFDASGVVVLYNQAAESIHDVARDRALDARLEELVEDSSLDCAELSEAVLQNRRSDLFARTSDGRSILVSVRPVRDRRREAMLTLVVLRDLDVIDHQRDAGNRHGAAETFRFRASSSSGASVDRDLLLEGELERAVGFGIRAMERRARVLITGETGVGKTVIARHLHETVCGSTRPFVQVNCGSIPETLFESEMFGYERGAFTGALQGGKKGLIESAAGGTLFLDEVGEIPLQCQAKLLKFLEDGSVQRVGGATSRRVDVRILAATNRNLETMIGAGLFRRDLFHRLKVLTIDVPPLREQPELIEPLIAKLLDRVNVGRSPVLELDEACRARLATYAYPGNVRELANILERLSVVCDSIATVSDMEEGAGPETIGQVIDDTMPLKVRVRAYEHGLIDEAVRRHGSKRKAARALGVDIGTVVRKTQAGRRS
jgi:PAS domain S-box-containing protein